MGTLLGYYGGAGIPEDRREEFSQRVLKILDYGGMMQVDEVSLYGRRLCLLSTPEADLERHSVNPYRMQAS